MGRRSRAMAGSVVTFVVALGLLGGCAADVSDHQGTSTGGTDDEGDSRDVAQDIIDGLEVNQEAAEMVPAEVRSTGKLTVVGFPYAPELFVGEDGSTPSGVTVSVGSALAKVLDLELDLNMVTSAANALVGIDSGRYDVMLHPQIDRLEKQQSYDFIDWQTNNEAFLFRSDNPFDSLEDLCGASVGVITGSTAERSTQTLSDRCVADGEAPVEMSGLENSTAQLLALESGRIDVMATGKNAALYILIDPKRSKTLEMLDAGDDINPISFAGSIVKKGDPLFDALFLAMSDLSASGDLEEIVALWTDPSILLTPPQKNAATE